MSLSYPLEYIAVSVEDGAENLVEYCLAGRTHALYHHFEICAGLEYNAVDDKDPANNIRLHPGMRALISPAKLAWALLPTLATLDALNTFQQSNVSCPLNERKSYLDAFDPTQHQYTLLPVRNDLQFFLAIPGEPPRLLSSSLLKVTVSANPLSVVFAFRHVVYQNEHPTLPDGIRDGIRAVNRQWLRQLPFGFGPPRPGQKPSHPSSPPGSDESSDTDSDSNSEDGSLSDDITSSAEDEDEAEQELPVVVDLRAVNRWRKKSAVGFVSLDKSFGYWRPVQGLGNYPREAARPITEARQPLWRTESVCGVKRCRDMGLNSPASSNPITPVAITTMGGQNLDRKPKRSRK